MVQGYPPQDRYLVVPHAEVNFNKDSADICESSYNLLFVWQEVINLRKTVNDLMMMFDKASVEMSTALCAVGVGRFGGDCCLYFINFVQIEGKKLKALDSVQSGALS